jgi:hypothetical protein
LNGDEGAQKAMGCPSQHNGSNEAGDRPLSRVATN